MNQAGWRVMVSGVAIAGVCILPAFAQDARVPQRPARGGQPVEGVSPAEIQQMFDAYVLMQAQDVLQLRDDQYPRFLSRLRALQAVRRRAETQRLQNINQLRRILQAEGGAPSEALIKERLKALDDLSASSAVEIRQALDAIDEVLDLRQQARFRILEEEMERKKVDLVTRTRQANRPNANRPRPPQ